jgi:hypothetical protein
VQGARDTLAVASSSNVQSMQGERSGDLERQQTETNSLLVIARAICASKWPAASALLWPPRARDSQRESVLAGRMHCRLAACWSPCCGPCGQKHNCVHRLSVLATQDRNVITALLRLQRLPAKTADGLSKTIKTTCIIFCQQSLSRNA